MVERRLIGTGQAGDAIEGTITVGREIAGASEDAAVSLASIRPPRTLAPGLAAASPIPARAGARAGTRQETGHTDL